jgi:hypothetical protein
MVLAVAMRGKCELAKHHQTVEILGIGNVVRLLEPHESRITDLATILMPC